MKILTEPVGSIPRPEYLIEGMQAFEDHQITQKNCPGCMIWRLKTRLKNLKKQVRR